MEQYTAGSEIPRRKKKYKDSAVRVQRIVNEFGIANYWTIQGELPIIYLFEY